ncbi:hypothetical protein AXG93_1913s1640 [Marchantia polymorpha subsp. ruderalis]|uniref:Uncharacterized protein n=1 Tax=Marchantia polymorpha subsp. ruderalis TaxID=1480154 RepID=A0A176WL78_MARPO|nr:hypothetical protein AXG93_1913s1640 [Marchantia polymorpha subsp. ruderalis]
MKLSRVLGMSAEFLFRPVEHKEEKRSEDESRKHWTWSDLPVTAEDNDVSSGRISNQLWILDVGMHRSPSSPSPSPPPYHSQYLSAEDDDGGGGLTSHSSIHHPFHAAALTP